jgi:hypothetical protein
LERKKSRLNFALKIVIFKHTNKVKMETRQSSLSSIYFRCTLIPLYFFMFFCSSLAPRVYIINVLWHFIHDSHVISNLNCVGSCLNVQMFIYRSIEGRYGFRRAGRMIYFNRLSWDGVIKKYSAF